MAGHLFRIASFGRKHSTARSSSDFASGAAFIHPGGDLRLDFRRSVAHARAGKWQRDHGDASERFHRQFEMLFA
jgi:hypothetical protein